MKRACVRGNVDTCTRANVLFAERLFAVWAHLSPRRLRPAAAAASRAPAPHAPTLSPAQGKDSCRLTAAECARMHEPRQRHMPSKASAAPGLTGSSLTPRCGPKKRLMTSGPSGEGSAGMTGAGTCSAARTAGRSLRAVHTHACDASIRHVRPGRRAPHGPRAACAQLAAPPLALNACTQNNTVDLAGGRGREHGCKVRPDLWAHPCAGAEPQDTRRARVGRPPARVDLAARHKAGAVCVAPPLTASSSARPTPSPLLRQPQVESSQRVLRGCESEVLRSRANALRGPSRSPERASPRKSRTSVRARCATAAHSHVVQNVLNVPSAEHRGAQGDAARGGGSQARRWFDNVAVLRGGGAGR
jgi:hypothetical protein